MGVVEEVFRQPQSADSLGQPPGPAMPSFQKKRGSRRTHLKHHEQVAPVDFARIAFVSAELTWHAAYL
jgi:hypothetical protein